MENNNCNCPDCFSGKIVSVAGPGCSLLAHEYEPRHTPNPNGGPGTPNGKEGCWNCGHTREIKKEG